MKKLIAVYDADTRYAERLSDYVNRKEKGVFTAQAFTSKEKLAEYAKKHEISFPESILRDKVRLAPKYARKNQ